MQCQTLTYMRGEESSDEHRVDPQTPYQAGTMGQFGHVCRILHPHILRDSSCGSRQHGREQQWSAIPRQHTDFG